jgi:hypothetical protein
VAIGEERDDVGPRVVAGAGVLSTGVPEADHQQVGGGPPPLPIAAEQAHL